MEQSPKGSLVSAPLEQRAVPTPTRCPETFTQDITAQCALLVGHDGPHQWPSSESPKGTTPDDTKWESKDPLYWGRLVMDLHQRLEAAEKEVLEWEEREAAVCDEDYSFEEVIKSLSRQLDAAVNALGPTEERLANAEATVSRLISEKQALIDGKVWAARWFDGPDGWRHATPEAEDPSPLFATADEALGAYLSPTTGPASPECSRVPEEGSK